MEAWSNYNASDGDMVHGWRCKNRRPLEAFEERLHGDGIFGEKLWMSETNKMQTPLYAN